MQTHIKDIAVSSDATIRIAMGVIDRGAVEIAFVIDPNERLIGTVTDGDIRRALLGGASLEDRINRFMQKQFTSVDPAVSRAEVLDLMRARVLRQVPVVDEDGRLVGLHLLREIIGTVRRPNWAVIMAGGRGVRLRPITDAIPKPMVPVAGRPILERLVLHLVGHGFRKIFISVNYKAEVIEQHFEDGGRFGCEIEYLRESQPLGTGGSLTLLPEAPEHPLVIMNGDLLTQVGLGALLNVHDTGGYSMTVGLREYSHTVPFGVVRVDDGKIVEIEEKPTATWLANAGIYVVNPSLISRIPSDTFFPITDLIEDCLNSGENVGAYTIEEEWIDIGQRSELKKARGED